MEFLLVIGIFGIVFLLLSIGQLFKKKSIKVGSCGSEIVVNGEQLSCGACPSKEAEICASGDKEGFATIAQIGNPSRKKKFKNIHFSKN
ncbi:hypothetical protein ACFLSX_00930 [Calditrichota bacterium]